MLIEVDVTKEIPKTINIEDINGSIIEQKVHFEWEPPYCFNCHAIGHNCAKKVPQRVKEQKVKQKWVPKAVNQRDNPTPTSTESEQAVTTVDISLKEGDDASREAEDVPKEVMHHIGDTQAIQQEKDPPPVWNIVTRGQKGKDVEVGGPGIITHLVDEVGTSTFAISPC